MKPETAPAPAEIQAPAETVSPLIAKLRDARDKSTGTHSFPLPCGVQVSYPKFRPFAAWERAQQMADTPAGVNLYYITQVCRFDGEGLRVEQYRELISDRDHMEISARVFNGKDEEGNA